MKAEDATQPWESSRKKACQRKGVDAETVVTDHHTLCRRCQGFDK